ncbi:MAG: preprotein translocase subunit YajC [Erysipelotrichales bacterium]|nr:preprotein translocase subunit YajC [Erysipelotrichales bacterium]MBQ2309832.1 preprotein translocase subunit YajC [Erysipelotrichales bacterium]
MNGNGTMFIMLVFVLFMGLQMWMISKQNKKQRAKMMEFQDSLKPGDKIILNTGIYGTIEQIDDLTAQVRIAENTVIKVERYTITRKEAPAETYQEPENPGEE